MIIDSHAHYSTPSYTGSFRYLTTSLDGYTLEDGDLPQLLQQMEHAGIRCSIEPGISLSSNEDVLNFCRAHPLKAFPAVGVHPTRAIREKWSARKRLLTFAAEPDVIAIGETGLDYHYQRADQHRLRQMMWFLYQLSLAKERQLPVILHIRNAHKDALRILSRHPARKLGGVVHCFTGNKDDALRYVRLGYHIGLGGAILQKEDRSVQLWEAVKAIPLERILVETDAPYVLPDCGESIRRKQLRKARNSSLILPEVIEKIAQLKGISPETVEEVTAQNAIRLFSLPINNDQ